MYTEFFGFIEKPFSLVPNPNYLYFSSKHRHALTFLEYGLVEKIGFVMLTGEIGIGKTTLIRYMLNRVEADMDVAVIFNTNILSNDLISLILTEFEIEHDDSISKAKALDILNNVLIQKYAAGRKVLLIIDEAQNLSDDVLEEIRMLSNLQTDEELLLQIMIVGQPNLRDKIQNPGLEQFAQRISASYHLSAMNIKETVAYIAHRLEKAGGSPDLFPMEVIEKIFEASAGIPRTINLLCGAALVYGYADETKEISLNILEQVIANMGVFTRQKMNSMPKNPSEDDHSEGRLKEKIAAMEQYIEQLTQTFDKQLKKVESRAELRWHKRVLSLKRLLALERKRSSSLLAHAYDKLKGEYEFAARLKQIK